MTPFQIEILMHHYCSNFPFPRREAPAYAAEVLAMQDLHLLDGGHRIMPRGEAYLSMLMATPLPEPIWIDPRDAKAAGIPVREG